MTIGGSTIAAELDSLAPWHSPASPIGRSEREARLVRARERLAAIGADALLVNAGRSLRYFTGIAWSPTERLVAMLLPVSGTPQIVCPAFERGSLEAELAIHAELLLWEADESPLALITDSLTPNAVLALDPLLPFYWSEPLRAWFRPVSAAPVIDALRMVKWPAERALMQQAKAITLELHRRAARMLAPGIRMRRGIVSLLGAAALASCAGAPPPVGPPPLSLALDPFYTKSVDASGIPISASQAVPDAALQIARRMIVAMLARRPDIARELVRAGQRVMVMGVDEQTTDVPEQRDWKKPAIDDPRLTGCERKHYEQRIGRLSDREYWSMRARGMGGLLTSAATENLLGLPDTRYYGETILVHEFAHAILSAVQAVDPRLYAQVEQAYAAAAANRLWAGEYGATTVQEYWAEGTQFWFNSNKLAVVEGVRILSDADLARHDPALAAVLRAVYGDRHRLPGDPFYKHPARVPPGPTPTSTAEIC